jgi:hypothetical protein
MKLAIMQPYFFPYLGYFQAIDAVDKYVLYHNLNYITEGWMNRNRIMMKNQHPIYINAFIDGKSSFKKISEIELLKTSTWRKKILNAIYLNYKGSVFFEEIYQLIIQIIQFDTNFLFELNHKCIQLISNYLEFKTEIIIDNYNYLELELELNKYDINPEKSILNEFLNQKVEKKVARVIAMCKIEKSNFFINAIGGKELYDKQLFKEHGIDLFFVETKKYKYPQFSKEFVPHLSIIDVLMHNGKAGTIELIKNYNLI